MVMMLSGIILETEGHPKDTKKGTFSLQKVKKGTPDLTSPYVYSLFITALKIKASQRSLIVVTAFVTTKKLR